MPFILSPGSHTHHFCSHITIRYHHMVPGTAMKVVYPSRQIFLEMIVSIKLEFPQRILGIAPDF